MHINNVIITIKARKNKNYTSERRSNLIDVLIFAKKKWYNLSEGVGIENIMPLIFGVLLVLKEVQNLVKANARGKNMDYKGCLTYIQNLLENSPLIVLGSGASIPYGLPSMSDLATEIKRHEPEFNKSEYDAFCENLSKMNLEEALDATNLSPESQGLIRKIVWEFINERDLYNFKNIASDSSSFAISSLITKVIQPAPNVAIVVTTNYDRNAEYAADIIGATAVTGFEGGIIRKPELPSDRVRNQRIRARERTVSIWKVHGSLDWFVNSKGEVVSYPLSAKIPDGHAPLIIPPGKDKYSTTHGEPYRDIISQADTAFSNAGSYLCIGYGFNDEHIQPKLLTQIRNGKPIVVLTHQATASCKQHIINDGVSKYAIVEYAAPDKTRVSANGWNGEFDGQFWNLPEFIKTVW